MLKYWLGFALVFGLAIYVAIQDERAAQQSAQESQQSSKSAIPAVPDANHPQQNVSNTERNSPSWYGFFRWPSGTTTWAILLTLFVIAEQTRLLGEYVKATKEGVEATHKSADAALLNVKAVIHAERPWVLMTVKRQDVDEPERAGVWGINDFEFTIANYGKSPAHVFSVKGPQFDVVDRPDQNLPVPPSYEITDWEKVFLAPNEKESIPIGHLDNPGKLKAKISEKSVNEGTGIKKGDLVAFGLIEYTDGISPKPYRTAFCLKYERGLAGGQLIPCGPPVYNEYT
jgi:hypothetical protein